jgi:hypothetical protein
LKTLLALLLLLAGCLGGTQKEPDKDASPSQPVPFNHKKHLLLNLKCAECHGNPDPGEAMTLPAASKCMLCHVAVAKDSADIQKLASFAKLKQDMPWVLVARIPSWVFFSHRIHLDADEKCESCHGQVSTMDVIKRETNVTTMGGCVSCHQKFGGPTGCLACHEGKH